MIQSQIPDVPSTHFQKSFLIWLLLVEFLDSVSQHLRTFFYFSGVDIDTEISLEIETKHIPKEKVEGKV